MKLQVGLVWVTVGVAILSLTSCSEKQKAAARLESQMRQEMSQDSVVAAQFDRTSDSLPAETAADTSAVAGESGGGQTVASDTPIRARVDSTSTDRTETLVHASGDTAATTTQLESTVPPDAGAIPDEEKIKPELSGEGDDAGAYVLQIASTPDRSYAERTVSMFTERGYQTHMTTAILNGITYYRVRIGRFPTSESAARVRDDITHKFGISGFVTRVR